MAEQMQKAPESEHAIRQSAMRLFATKGYNATSVREIVEAAGVTKPTLYYYFQNKEELYRRLILETMEDVKADVYRAVVEAEGFRAELIAVANAHFRWLRREPLLSAALFRAIFGAAPDQQHFDVNNQAKFEEELLMDIFSRAARHGEIDESCVSMEHIRAFFSSFHIYIMRQAIGMEDDLGEGLATRIVDFFLSGLKHFSEQHKDSVTGKEEVK